MSSTEPFSASFCPTGTCNILNIHWACHLAPN